MGGFLPIRFRTTAHGNQTFARWAAWDQTRTFGGLDDIFSVGTSAAFARQAQRRFACPKKHGLEHVGFMCHAEAKIGGMP
jgi:hypothetical protein